ncbi:MAG: hypothetical protein BGO55_30495 [Sphingobacteriales bacterium 50-39]|nr:hypothetical protein [Sphingobacteriales bacterium]OJW60849.1 MAG: hypothetical protein BGO55_30495 [Sphingobacteriales bacterium 50-39]
MLRREEIDIFIPPATHYLSKEDRGIFSKYHRTRRRKFIIGWLCPLLGLVVICTYVAICLVH